MYTRILLCGTNLYCFSGSISAKRSKKEVSELPRVPICFHCWAHSVSLRSDACDFPPDNYEEQEIASAHSLSGEIYTDGTLWVLRGHRNTLGANLCAN